MGEDWDEEITGVIEPRDTRAPVSVSRDRFEALCQVVEALLCGRFDEKSLRVEVTGHDRFARLEASVQALCEEVLRITGRRRLQTNG